MIRPFTSICMVTAALSGLYLYQTKHRAQLLDQQIARTYKQIDQTKERVGLLKGEWALLNEPDRLGDLSQQHLALKTLAPSQFVALADLSSRLAAPLPPGSVTLPADMPGVPVAAASPPPAPASGQVPAAAQASVQASIQVAAGPAAAARSSAAAPKLLASNDKPVEKAGVPVAAAVPGPVPGPGPVPSPVPGVAAAPGPAGAVAAGAQPARPASRVAAPDTKLAAATVPAAPGKTPHIMAPVVSVAASAINPAALAPGSVGESVARHMQGRQMLGTAGGTMGGTLPGPSGVQAVQQVGAGPIPTYAQPASPYAGMGSALGNATHRPLPAPVPYGTAASR